MPVFWLPWREVDPEGRPPPDPVAVRDAALAVMRAVPRPWEPHVTWTIARSVSVRLVADFGPRRDAARSKERATRMSLALDAARSSARQGLPLDLTRLASWQRVVLDVELAPLRRSDAHAKGGRERYGTPADLRALAEACLADALEPGVSPIVRAVRLYLDICFLHPFADGNARSARLALDYVLSREGLALHSAEVLFGLPRWAHDPGMPYEMMQALAYLVGER